MAGQYEFGSKEELIKAITFRDGKVFISGEEIPVAMKGEPGLMGKRGLTGDPPKHEVDGTKIRFQNPDKTWGPWVDLKGVRGADGKDGKDGKSIKGEPGKPGESVKGDKGDPGKSIKGDKGDRGLPSESIKGDKGDPGLSGVEPEEMLEIRTNLLNMKEAIDAMNERVSNVKDGRDGTDGKDGKNGKDGVSVQGPEGRQGIKGEPGIPPHDWNVTLNNVARIVRALEKMGVEI